jgi:hypothetical protein
MTEGGAVEAAATLVYNAAFVHFEDHRGRDCVSERCDVWKVALDRYAEAIAQAAQEEAEAKVARLREALQQAEKIIRTWHGMAMNPDEEERVWRIYRDRSPEMKIIRQALSDEGRTEEVTR